MLDALGDLLIAAVCFGILFGLFCWGEVSKVKDEAKKSSKYKDKGLVYRKEYNNINYYGGFGDIESKKDVSAIMFSDRIRILDRDILYCNIQDYSIITDTQLSEKVSMGKLLCFGVFAFGMKGKTKETNKNYVIIRCRYENKDRDIVLDLGSRNEEFVRNIRELITIKENKNYTEKHSVTNNSNNAELNFERYSNKESNDEELANSILYNYDEE